MVRLKKPIKCKIDDKDVEIKEINISSEKFTPRQLLEAEREFLLTGGIFAQGEMESSRAYLAAVAAKIAGCSYDDLIDNVSCGEFLEITNQVKGLFISSGLENLLAKISEKQS